MRNNLKETFAKEVNSINPNIEVLGNYINWNTPVLCKCKICEHEWKGRAAVLLYGGGCPQCSRKKANKAETLSLEEVSQRIYKVNPNIEVVGEYWGVHKNLKCKCKIHMYEWEALPIHLFKGESGCPICKKERMRKRFSMSQDEFESAVSKKNPNIVVKGTYINNDTPIECSCLIHKNTFMVNPRCILYKTGNVCPLCFPSMGEQNLIRLLKSNGFNIETQKCFAGCVYQKPLRFDAYDLDNNIAYEYQGEQHYHPVNFNGYDKNKSEEDFNLNKIRDKIKKDYCMKNDIHLIEIPYWEYENMEIYLKEKWNQLGLIS